MPLLSQIIMTYRFFFLKYKSTAAYKHMRKVGDYLTTVRQIEYRWEASRQN